MKASEASTILILSSVTYTSAQQAAQDIDISVQLNI
jgi:hypothetical protein